jgi:hypothetical protein
MWLVWAAGEARTLRCGTIPHSRVMRSTSMKAGTL